MGLGAGHGEGRRDDRSSRPGLGGAQLIVDPANLSPGSIYRFMIGAVVPRPIAFISTVGESGRFNVAPFSYFNAICSQPPLLGVSINRRSGKPKDTFRNIQDTGDFVVNVVDEALADRMVQASGDWPDDVDEFELTGLTPAPSDLVRAPRVKESPIAMECRLHRVIELGTTFFVVGEIVRAHVDERVMSDGVVDPLKLHPVGRLGGDGYVTVREVDHRARPKVQKR